MDKRLTPEELLTILQEVDQNQRWYSLDDKRVCIVCVRTFSGRQIEVLNRGSNGFSLHCPTPDCPSDSIHWILWEPAAAKETADSAKPAGGEFSFL